MEEAIKAARAQAPEQAVLSSEVGPDDIATVVARWTGIPMSRLQQAERARLLRLKADLHQRVIGQVRTGFPSVLNDLLPSSNAAITGD